MGSSSNSTAFNFSLLKNQPEVPAEFLWPENDVTPSQGDLEVPIVDLRGFSGGDSAAKGRIAAAVREACEEHGTFQVVNHGVDSGLVDSVEEIASWFFELPAAVKLKAEKSPGDFQGYSSAPSERFSNLLWTEALAFHFSEGPTPVLEDFFRAKELGQDFEKMGKLYQKYCESMKRLSMELMELIGTSLGLKDHRYYGRCFEEGTGIFRCNYYPPCQQPERILGIGPHCDPAALVLLLQDAVSGLEVSTRGVWRTLQPYPGAFVVNIGDLFMALSNGKYKSCLHRVRLNREKARKSFTFHCCPRDDMILVPPSDLTVSCCDSDGGEASRKYPDFTWSDYRRFLSGKSRSEGSTLDDFSASFSASREDTAAE